MIGSLVSPRFVGRAAELGHLLEGAERVRAGEPATFLVAGEAGVGKSRLVTELSGRLSEDGWRVLTGECVELGGDGLPETGIELGPLEVHHRHEQPLGDGGATGGGGSHNALGVLAQQLHLREQHVTQ